MNVLIVDDDALVGLSLKTIIEAAGDIRVCAVGRSAADAETLFAREQPDMLLMDIRMGAGGTGLDAGAHILAACPAARILFLTTFSDDDYIIRALHMGAKGYLLKQDYESIVPALRAVFAGQTVFGGEIVAKIPSLLHARPDFSTYGLSEKDTELLACIAEGLSNREIAARLFLSEGTVRNNVSALLLKLDLRGRTQLAVFYYRHHGYPAAQAPQA